MLSAGLQNKERRHAVIRPLGQGSLYGFEVMMIMGWIQDRKANDLTRCGCHDDEHYQASVAIVSDAVRHSLRRNEHQSCLHLNLTFFQ